MIDAIVDRREQRDYLDSSPVKTAPRSGYRRAARFRPPRNGPEVPAWDAVQRARGARRLTSVDYLERMLGEFIELHGDRPSGDDPAIVAGIGTPRWQSHRHRRAGARSPKTVNAATMVVPTRRGTARRAASWSWPNACICH